MVSDNSNKLHRFVRQWKKGAYLFITVWTMSFTVNHTYNTIITLYFSGTVTVRRVIPWKVSVSEGELNPGTLLLRGDSANHLPPQFFRWIKVRSFSFSRGRNEAPSPRVALAEAQRSSSHGWGLPCRMGRSHITYSATAAFPGALFADWPQGILCRYSCFWQVFCSCPRKTYWT